MKIDMNDVKRAVLALNDGNFFSSYAPSMLVACEGTKKPYLDSLIRKLSDLKLCEIIVQSVHWVHAVDMASRLCDYELYDYTPDGRCTPKQGTIPTSRAIELHTGRCALTHAVDQFVMTYGVYIYAFSRLLNSGRVFKVVVPSGCQNGVSHDEILYDVAADEHLDMLVGGALRNAMFFIRENAGPVFQNISGDAQLLEWIMANGDEDCTVVSSEVGSTSNLLH